MEAKEIIEIIAGILASAGLFTCLIAASYCLYSMLVIDKHIKQKKKLKSTTLPMLMGFSSVG